MFNAGNLSVDLAAGTVQVKAELKGPLPHIDDDGGQNTITIVAADKAGKPISYPSMDALRAEDQEEAPAVLLTISDSTGAPIRTLTGPTNTLAGGSSLGGLISLYFGRESTVFGKIAILSPAFWVAPNYLTQVRSGVKKPARVYLDMGTAESDSAWNDCLGFYDTLLSQGYAPNGDLLHVTGCGCGSGSSCFLNI